MGNEVGKGGGGGGGGGTGPPGGVQFLEGGWEARVDPGSDHGTMSLISCRCNVVSFLIRSSAAAGSPASPQRPSRGFLPCRDALSWGGVGSSQPERRRTTAPFTSCIVRKHSCESTSATWTYGTRSGTGMLSERPLSQAQERQRPSGLPKARPISPPRCL